MRKEIIILVVFLINFNLLFSQSTFRFIDSETSEPMCGIYSNIYKNGDTFADCGATNKEGYRKIRIRNFDSLATYQISLNNLKYKSIWKKIDFTKNDTITYLIEKDDYYITKPKKNLLYSGCSTYSFPNYYPRQPRSLDDLPDSIATKVTQYLMKRVGIEKFKQFNLIGGQILDVDEYIKRNPKSKAKISYYLCFSFRDLKNGIGMYSSKIHLDKNGNTLKHIDFPIIKKGTIQEKIIPLKYIKLKAKDRGFLNEKTEIKMTFSSINNILIWKLINETNNSDYTYLKEELIYNAHNGNFIKINSYKGEWID